MDELRVEIETLKACNSKLESCALNFNASFSDFSFGSSSSSEASSILGGIQSAISRCVREINNLYVQHFLVFNSYVNDLSVLDKVLSGQRGNLTDEEANSILNDLPSIDLDNDVKFDKDWDSYIDSFDETFEDIMSKGGSYDEVSDFVNYANNQMVQIYNQIQSGTLSEEEMKQAIEQYNEWYEYANKWAAGTEQVLENEKTIDAWDDSIIDEYKKFLNSNVYTRDYDGYVADINDEMAKLRNEIKTNKNLSAEEQNLLRKKLETYRQIAEQLGRGYGFESTTKRQLEEMDIELASIISQGATADDIRAFQESINSNINNLKAEIKSGKLSEEEAASKKMQLDYLAEYSKKLGQQYGEVYTADKQYEEWLNGLQEKLTAFQNGNHTAAEMEAYKAQLLAEIYNNGNLNSIEQNLNNRKSAVINALENDLNNMIDYTKEYEQYVSEFEKDQETYMNLLKEKQALQSLTTKTKEVEKEIANIDSQMKALAYSNETMLNYAYNNDVNFQIDYDIFINGINQYGNISAQIEQEMANKKYLEETLKNLKQNGNTDAGAYYSFNELQKQLEKTNNKIDSLNCDVASLANQSDDIFGYIYQNNSTFRKYLSDQQTAMNIDNIMNQKTQYELALMDTSLATWEVNKYNSLISDLDNQIATAMDVLGCSSSDNSLMTNASRMNVFRTAVDDYNNEIQNLKDKINSGGYSSEQIKNFEQEIKHYETLINNCDKKIKQSNIEYQYEITSKYPEQETLNQEIENLQDRLNNPYLTETDRNKINSMINEDRQMIAIKDIYEKLHEKNNSYELDRAMYDLYKDAMAENSINYDYTVGMTNEQLINHLKVQMLYEDAKKFVNSDQGKQFGGVFDETHEYYLNMSENVYHKINPEKTPEEVKAEQELLYQQMLEQQHQQKLYDLAAKGDTFGYIKYDIARKLVDFGTDVGESVSSGWNDFCDSVSDTWDKQNQLFEDFKNGEISALEYFAKNIAANHATALQLGSSILTGASRAVEGVIDTAITAVHGYVMLGGLAVDGISALFDGNFDGSATNAVCNNMYNIVGTDHVGNIESKFYDTAFGKWIDENALFTHDSGVANVVKGVSEVVAMIAASAGISSVLSSGKFASSGIINAVTRKSVANVTGEAAIAAARKNAINMATNITLASIKGYGQGMQRALNDGAEGWKAGWYGLASGAWEGVQWSIGGKINSWAETSLAAGQNAAKVFTKAVAADTIDSAVEGFVQPGLQMMYSDDSYGELFEKNGGWGTVVQQAAIGGIMSAAGTGFDVVKAKQLSNAQTPKVVANTTVSNISSKVKDLYNYINKRLTDNLKTSGITLEESNILWLQNTLVNRFNNEFGAYVSPNRTSVIPTVTQFYERIAFEKKALSDKLDPKTCAGYNNGIRSVVRIDPDRLDRTKSFASHESIHHISNNKFIDENGIKFTYAGVEVQYRDINTQSLIIQNRGLNETITEYLNSIVMKGEYPKDYYCAYQYSVDRFETLTAYIEGLDDELIKKAYLTNDLSLIANAIDDATYPGFFVKLNKAFDSAILNNDIGFLDDCLTEVALREFDDVTVKIDVDATEKIDVDATEKLDDITEKLDDITEKLDDITEKLDIEETKNVDYLEEYNNLKDKKMELESIKYTFEYLQYKNGNGTVFELDGIRFDDLENRISLIEKEIETCRKQTIYDCFEKMDAKNMSLADCLNEINILKSLYRGIEVDEIAILRDMASVEYAPQKTIEIDSKLDKNSKIILNDTTKVEIYGDKNNINMAHNLLALRRVYDSLPEIIKNNVSTITLVDGFNPDDIYWKLTYNDFHYSAATGGGGEINIYNAANLDYSSNLAEFKEILLHEGGHNIDSALGGLSDSIEWQNAQLKDSSRLGYKEVVSVTKYGSNSLAEDFAESIKLFYSDPESFKLQYPNRAAIFKKYLKNI